MSDTFWAVATVLMTVVVTAFIIGLTVFIVSMIVETVKALIKTIDEEKKKNGAGTGVLRVFCK